MRDEDSLSIEFGKLKALARGRFAIVVLVGSLTLLAGVVGYMGGSRLMEWALDRQTTASIEK
jgi:hypothetical protein